MKALLFVYTPSSFHVGGAFPLKRFEPGVNATYTDASPAIGGNQGGTLAPGVYGYISDDNFEPPIRSTSGAKPGVDYEIFLLKGKDPWVSFTSQLARMRTVLPAAQDGEIDTFMIAKNESD